MDGWENNMGNKIKTIALLLVVGFLLASTLYISYLLRSESKSAPTTVKKTKAATLTYSKSVSINSFSPTATKIPSPTISLTPTVVPTNAFSIAGSMATAISPTAVVPTLANVSPTEVLLAQTTSTPTPSAVSTATTTRAQTLPETGWIKPAHIMFVFAFSLIIFSLIF